MFSLSGDKIRPIVSLDLDGMDDGFFHCKKENCPDPFLFLKKRNELVAYIRIKDLLSKTNKDGKIPVSVIEECSVPLDNIPKLSSSVSIPDIFQIIGEPIAIIKNAEGNYTGYIKREDALAELFKHDGVKSFDLLKIILTSIPMGIFVVDREKNIIQCNDSGLKMIRMKSEDVLGKKAEQIFNGDHINRVFSTGDTILNQIQISDHVGVLVDYSPIIDYNDEVEGIIIIVQDLPMVEEMAMEIEHIKNLNKDLNAILSTIYDEILVVNNKGELIRYSESFIPDFWGVQLKDILGKNLVELENKGLFKPSVTRLVLEKKKKVSIVQETNSGKKILAVGNPVFDENGEIDRIIIASRDITETTKLKTELREMKKITDQYKQELDSFKTKDRLSKKLIYCSSKMERIMDQVMKVSEFSSTVLIYGESGVGKEVIAQAIHQLGKRSNHPFLRLNCGAIPENLLESELFGYVRGSFTGADKNGKVGYFQQADKGILFLDEIGEMPMSLQVKLLRVLQEQEVVPIGSTVPIPIDVQIIAATNRNLEKMVEEGKFREDLYYRLNVIPIRVPPLRERPEDIPLLAFHFLQQFNERYNRNFHLSPDALNLLEVYSWPGNVRELQNVIERLAVSTDNDTIDAKDVDRILSSNIHFKREKPVISRVMPLQEALDYVEEQLILLAMKQYKTTTKAAKALRVSQSSVSRKYQKILKDREKESQLKS
ncbi:sigma 54-interacting transcriptional regulator [Aeribacillus sp. FSL W8-0870]|jgi:PAS domain S-box-containing protein|uniref:sigma 54-interacting transcriptional regulator n=1 Tax=Aeribacillus sp. FSL W8-0870 TaxID=2954706 RepID=UPI0030CFC301